MYYASGTNRGVDIAALRDVWRPGAMHIGIAVDQCNGACRGALRDLAGSPVQVFVDSGAFSEVKFGPGGPQVVKPITSQEWDRRLAVYDDLADALGSQLSVVAPDQVGNQAKTLERLRRYAAQMQALRAKGVRVLVPVQKGPMPQAEFFERARQAVGIPDAVPAIPMKKAATTPEEALTFLEAARPPDVHLLGVGPTGAVGKTLLPELRRRFESMRVTHDSNALRALVAREKGRSPRALTKAMDEAAAWLSEEVWAPHTELAPDYTDEIAQPSNWLPRTRIRDLGVALGLRTSELKSFVSDPEAWLQQDGRYQWPHVQAALDTAWAERWTKLSSDARRRAAVLSVFGDER